MIESSVLSEFRAKFQVDDLIVARTPAWSWSVRPNQPTLGSGILSLNRHALHFSDVKPAEMAELAELIQTLERAINSTFNHNIMNYLMLMMVDHQVHFHVIPRYDGNREFAGLEWSDNGWPALPVLADSQHKNHDGALSRIQDELKAASHA